MTSPVNFAWQLNHPDLHIKKVFHMSGGFLKIHRPLVERSIESSLVTAPQTNYLGSYFKCFDFYSFLLKIQTNNKTVLVSRH